MTACRASAYVRTVTASSSVKFLLGACTVNKCYHAMSCVCSYVRCVYLCGTRQDEPESSCINGMCAVRLLAVSVVEDAKEKPVEPEHRSDLAVSSAASKL